MPHQYSLAQSIHVEDRSGIEGALRPDRGVEVHPYGDKNVLLADELLESFWKAGVVLLGPEVQDRYGLSTPIFIDLRQRLYEDVALIARLGKALHQRLAEIVGTPPKLQQQVLGIPDTATPLALATATASLSSIYPLLYAQLRKQPATYPGGQLAATLFMGTWKPDREITLIDDVLATGRTKLWAIEQLNKHGIPVARILVVVDRQEGGDEILRSRGYPLYSLYTIAELFDYYVTTGKINASTAQNALEYLHRKKSLHTYGGS